MEQYDYGLIGKELKRLRTEHAYTQQQMAKQLGCTVSFISNVENNRAKLSLRVLTYYAKLFHVSVDSILNAGQTDAESQNASSVWEAEALDVLKQFSEADRKRIIKTLQYIREIMAEGNGIEHE